MKITLASIGKTKSGYLKEGISEYQKRLQHYCTFNYVEYPDVKNRAKLKPDQIKKAEEDLILQQLQPSDYLVLLDEGGKQFTSVEWANWFSKRQLSNTKHLFLLIGGAYGFSQPIYQRANEKVSMSKMTFSHQMIRLLVTEQIYRAHTILKGEPYHHQ
ncbi:MAG: 23S rRNA (pseudouridine(1915)-N(3))-methyltransferase RlmH [Flavobacteriales bacterium]|nr:23S rRNA (pseudouridine(1915)-N(3))-methyltransferase RlmH [Flavobacteriales bacterium]